MVLAKLVHVTAMIGVITLWVGPWIIWDLVARTGDRSALRRVDHVSQMTSQIGFTLLLVGVAAGFVTAIVGGFDLTAPWLLIAYALLLSDLVLLRWIGVHVARVRAAQNDPEADLKAVASSPRAGVTLAVVVAFWFLLVADMVLKPFS
jgi:predicted signal transduction protein with EAL and GGDEF domain